MQKSTWIAFFEPGDAFVGAQSPMAEISSIGLRQRTTRFATILLYVLNKARGIDEFPFVFREHWHIDLAAPTIGRPWHTISFDPSLYRPHQDTDVT